MSDTKVLPQHDLPAGGFEHPPAATALSSNEKIDAFGDNGSDSEKGGAVAVLTADGAVFEELASAESGHDIKFRTLSWKRAGILLATEYVCLAISSFAWSFSVMGFAGGVIFSIGYGLVTWYTSYVLWQYCLLHPEARDLVDIGYLLFGKSSIAMQLTLLGLVLNNLFIVGLHTLTGSKILNTLSDHATCSVVFSVVTMVVGIVLTLPRTLRGLTTMGIASAICMFIGLLLCIIFAGTESNPAYGYGGLYPKLGASVVVEAAAPAGSTWIAVMNAILNITYTYVGQALLPSFIAEMERPQDFPKALTLSMLLEIVLFTGFGIFGYAFTGQYATAPLFGSLQNPGKKISFGFVIVPTLIIGVIYASTIAKVFYLRILGNSDARHSHSAKGWSVWIGCVIVTWVLGWIVGECIPFFGDLLSIMSSLFDSFFGMMFWSIAYFRINRGRAFSSIKYIVLSVINVLIFIGGLVMLGPGTYTSVIAIIADFAGPTKHPFSCADNSL